MTQINLERREAALKRIILDAGATALRRFRSRQPGEFSLKGPQDFLTEADTLVEQQIRQAIADAFPDDALLGEETGSKACDTACLWVVDPIDGTANFARGIEHFCVAMAFVHQGITELGAIYNPMSQELYMARRGRYAQKNGQALHTAQTDHVHNATIELGWSTRIPQRRYLDVMTAILSQGANVRRGSSGALALAWVAEGRTDGYAELHMNAWDCLAGLLLVREAGGSTGYMPTTITEIFNGCPVLAAAPDVAPALARATGIPVATAEMPLADDSADAKSAAPHYARPAISLIESDFPGWGMDIYIGGADGATDLALLEQHDIRTVINCAVNLDIDWVSSPEPNMRAHQIGHGSGPIRYYKLGLVDGSGNAPTMLHAGYHLMRSALLQQIPDKPSYRNREPGNILVNCRGGRSRSVTLVALFIHLECPERYPTLASAIAHIRDKRQLHPDEWYETPKPELISLAQRAIEMEQTLIAAGLGVAQQKI
ncbi:inositol monophosphatase [Brenneria roseae subsp. roseae]|uniref:inositol monophosphatase family protein n=1 Tax=Brenneria roseae TaxID=1509241 RepID=UPI000D60F9B2|nr:inositol monophosphatase family protein [Brenneria roseae]PWC22778.1 inositol monophosphatase [Brenneria roseae subsp. roseae]